ncbi:hypothetical protein HMSSN036_04050 [Paenibacillus macerans]|nr:hypothetical protein HMSSN036_04050 [Paenibacillus macerans]
MQKLIQATDSVRKGKYDTRLSLRTSDEIGELAIAFNHMAEELENTIRSLRHEKEHLSSVLRSMNDAVITLDREGAVILTNPPGDQILSMWGDLDEEDAGFEIGGQDAGGRLAPQPLLQMFRRVLDREGDQRMNVHVMKGVWSVHMAPLSSDGESAARSRPARRY